MTLSIGTSSCVPAPDARHPRGAQLFLGIRGPEEVEHLDLNRTRASLCVPAQPLPYDANSFAAIRCEHVLEELSFAERATLLLNCHKLLVPGGELTLILWNDECPWLFDEGESPGLAALTGFASEIQIVAVDSPDGNPHSAPILLRLRA